MKKLLSLVALVLCITFIAGCAGGGSTTPATDKPAGETATTDGGSGEYTITMIESLTSPERTAVIREIADKFEAENPGIKVEIISPPLENADQKISQMLQAGQKLDIVEVRDHTITMLINNNWIAPINSYVDGWEHKDTLTEPTRVSMSLMGDNTYLIPSGLYQRSLFYRTDWFEAQGVEVPATWQDVYDISAKLTDTSKNQFGWSFRGGKGGVDYIDMLYWSYNGYDVLADPFNAYFTKDGKTIYSTPESLEALKFYKELYEKGSPSDSIAWSYPEMVQGFVGGTTAMLIQDPEVIITCENSMEAGTWATAPIPVGPSGQSMSPAGYGGWGMTTSSENPEATMKFLLYLSNPENNTLFCSKHSLIPIHTTASDLNPMFKEGPFAVFGEMAAKPDTYKLVLTPQGYKAYSEHRATADEWYQKYLSGGITAEECLKHFDEYWTKALEEEGKIWEK